MLQSTLRAMLAGLGLSACYSPEVDGRVSASGGEASATSGAAGGEMAGDPGDLGAAAAPGATGAQRDPKAAAAGGEAVVPAVPPVALPAELPAPCLGIPYRAQLEATAGAGAPYTWRALSPLPDGLGLDPSAGVLTGTPTADGTFRVEVRDRDGVASQPLDVVLERRQTCSFAYLEGEGGPARLHYRDVFLSAATNVVLPAELAAGETVVDFEFSPDGTWIALRIELDARQRLALYPTRRDGTLASDAMPLAWCGANEPECSVLDYAWSANSEYLAVAVHDAESARDALTGIRVAAPTEPWPLVSSADWDFGPVALEYRGQLGWVASEWVGFMGADPGSGDAASEALYSAAVADDGRSLEEAWIVSSIASVGTRLLATATGLVSIDAGADTLSYFRRLGGYPNGDVVRHPGGVLSPSRRLLVSADGEGVLQLSELDREGGPSVVSEAQTCSTIVAWSPREEPGGAERFACRYGDTIRVFEYGAAPEPGALARVAEVSFTSPLEGARRAFSATGSWLLLSELAPETKRVALFDVARNDGSLERIPASCCSVLQPASGRDALALAGESLLLEYPLPTSGHERSLVLGGSAPAVTPCEEIFSRDPARWCGAPHVDNQLEYSAEGQSLLLEWPQGTLSIADMSQFSQQSDASARPITQALVSCDGCRPRPFAFGR
ncbi:MAG TPA: Ig domain-containing protein [Polyangiaceae bacterium]|nr:Ig domain-containing protein [Polyangiaceae bacterium]